MFKKVWENALEAIERKNASIRFSRGRSITENQARKLHISKSWIFVTEEKQYSRAFPAIYKKT